MRAKYENQIYLKDNKLCPFNVHYECRAFNEISNWHSNLEVILILGGTGCVQYGAETLQVQQGDIIVFNPKVLHRVHKSEDVLYHCIILDEEFCVNNGILTDQLQFCKQFRSKKTERLCRNVAESYRQYEEHKTALDGAKTRNAVLSLLVDLNENHLAGYGGAEAEEKNKAEHYVKKVASYLMEHYTEPVSLDHLAALCGISKCHLAREFKRYTGQTILTYANLIRCKHAEQCISSGMTVTETTMECGFESISYFSRTYKKLLGVSPSKSK